MNTIEKDFKAFYETLEEDSKRRQTMSIEEFAEYEDLFKHEYRSEDLKELAEKFFQRIDPYSPIKITDGDKIMFTLPPCLFPLKSITTDNKESAQKFYNLIQSDLPRIKSEGVQHYIKGLAKSQLTNDNKEKISEYKRIYLECFNSIKNLYETKDNSIRESVDNIESADGIQWD